MTESSAESIVFEGTPVDAAVLAQLLYAYSRMPPDPMAPDSSSWGHTKAGQLAAAVRGTGLEPAFCAELASLLTGDLLCVWLATALCRVGDVAPMAVADAWKRVDAHVAALEWVDPASADLRDCVRGLWARHVGAGLLPFRSSYRPMLHEDWSAPLLGAALVYDHAATLAGLDALLAEGDDAIARFGVAVRTTLRRSEGETLRNLLQREQRVTPTPERGRCIEALTYYLDRDILPDAGPVRWQRR